MIIGKDKIAYVVSDLKRIGPTNQTFNIILHSGAINNCLVITLFKESIDSKIDDFRSKGIPVLCLGLTKKNVLIKGISNLKKILNRENVYVVHSWGSYADFVSHYACKSIGLSHIITLRCFPMEDAPTRMNPLFGYLLAFVMLHIYKNSQHIIACSKSIKDKMEKHYKWAKLCYIQNGVDISYFKHLDYNICRKRLEVCNNELVFITMGSLIPRKRILETIEAFNASYNFNKKLWILGDGYLYRDLIRYQNDKVVFFGKVPDVIPYLSAADVFISSSESEGMPNAVLESIACTKPVILSNIPQHVEIISVLKGCGITYPLGDKISLSNIISNISKEEITSMTLKCMQISHSPLVMNKMGEKYGNYYSKI